jgi:uncharacterized membrane protein YraQ (UPF0718 family)
MMAGLLIAALARAYLRRDTLARLVARPGIGSIVRAALIGVPLPLCSCGVLPMAISLKRRGASRGATVSFLVSTPETGVDSIAVTWALLDPIMTLARPLAAFITAMVSGVAAEKIGGAHGTPATTRDGDPVSAGPAPVSCSASSPESCCCSDEPSEGCGEGSQPSGNGDGRLRSAAKYIFFDFLADIGPWFLVGVFLAGVVVVLVPSEWVSTAAGGGLPSMVLMLLIGIPVYICASASTPIAAALVLQGASPGAALVFLLAGPATNVASVVVLLRELGGRVVTAYLAAIVLCSLGLGMIVDFLYASFAWPVRFLADGGAERVPPPVQWIAATALLLFIVAGRLRDIRWSRKEQGA